jgi:hypothetical protein
MVTVAPATEHAPVAVIAAVVLELLDAVTAKVDPTIALAGAPVKLTVGVARATV